MYSIILHLRSYIDLDISDLKVLAKEKIMPPSCKTEMGYLFTMDH